MPDLLDGAEPEITFDDLKRCARREVAMRQSVYPRLIEKDADRKAELTRELTMMEAIADGLDEMEAVVQRNSNLLTIIQALLIRIGGQAWITDLEMAGAGVVNVQEGEHGIRVKFTPDPPNA